MTKFMYSDLLSKRLTPCLLQNRLSSECAFKWGAVIKFRFIHYIDLYTYNKLMSL